MVVLIPLALIDIVAAGLMLLYHFEFLPWKMLLPFSIYLIGKGVAFRDLGSIGDMIAGLYIVAMIVFGLQSFFVYLFAIYLVQKAAFSFTAYT